MAGRIRNFNEDSNIWPGFVDALSALLLVVIFTLLIFVVAQFYLNEVIVDKDKSLDEFKTRISNLTQQLDIFGDENDKLTDELDREQIAKKALQVKLSAIEAAKIKVEDDLASQKKLSLSAQQEIDLLTYQLNQFNDQVARLSSALQISNEKVESQNVQLKKLRINEALIAKIEEIQRYRSSFFEELKKALGDRGDMRIEGDRFVFQSEVLFATASADLGPDGIKAVKMLGETLQEIIREIPAGVNWVLRVDGHTDKRPLRNNARFPSNWELSFARAMEVVRTLMTQGVPADRLVATGYGEHYPVTTKSDPESLKKNRRIEIRFDQR